MKTNRARPFMYAARESYQHGADKDAYERERFSGILGRYRYAREQRAINALVDMLPQGISVADCPCGNGRWWSALAKRANRIIAVDISRGMLEFAQELATEFAIDIEVRQGDAENLDLRDGSVDYTFSHALTKHLPIPVQYQVLSEFSRISRSGVICSFGVFSHLTYEVWRRRNIEESYPTFFEELKWMAEEAGLSIRAMRKCTTPVGVEYSVLFDKHT